MKKNILRLCSMLLLLCLLPACGEKSSGVSGRKNLSGVFVDSGYYHVDTDGFLKYTELSSGTTVCLCQKVGCQHSDSDVCEGYVGKDGGIVGTALFYWNEGIYYLRSDEYGTHLYRRNPDGTGLSTVATLCKSYMEELKEISFSVLDGIVHDGKLYYSTIIYAVVETDIHTVTSVPIADLINCVDLRTGKEETLIKNKENRLELVDVQDGILYYMEITMGDTSVENYGDTIGDLSLWLKKYDLSTQEHTAVFEKKRAEFTSALAFTGNKLYYYKLTDTGNENHCYDVKSGEDTIISMDRLIVLNDRYILRRPQKGWDWELLDLQKDKVLDCSEFAGRRLSLQNVSDKGAVFKRTEFVDGMSTGQPTYFYVAFKSLVDGMQEEDCVFFQ